MLSLSHSIATLVAGLFAAVPVLQGADHPATTGEAVSGSVLMYIGTYTGPKSKGIYLSRLDVATGALSAPELAGEMVNPSWVTIHPSHKYLYACGESGPYPGGGAIGGFAIGHDGRLTAINQQPPGGAGPCHLAIDASGRHALVSNYGSGSIADLPIASDGSLGKAVFTDQHPTLGEQAKPHAHCMGVDPANHFALACDAGLDRLYSYRMDAASGVLSANEPPFMATAPGSHPRHLVFAAGGHVLYTINEAGMSVSAFSYDKTHGTVTSLQTVSSLPAGTVIEKGWSTAELILHPSGKFLYGSNRGPDSLVAYAIDAQSGKLTLIGHTPTAGHMPRGFGVDPSGHWLIVGNQDSDSVVEFAIDQKTGALSPAGKPLTVGAPVCFQFLATAP